MDRPPHSLNPVRAELETMKRNLWNNSELLEQIHKAMRDADEPQHVEQIKGQAALQDLCIKRFGRKRPHNADELEDWVYAYISVRYSKLTSPALPQYNPTRAAPTIPLYRPPGAQSNTSSLQTASSQTAMIPSYRPPGARPESPRPSAFSFLDMWSRKQTKVLEEEMGKIKNEETDRYYNTISGALKDRKIPALIREDTIGDSKQMLQSVVRDLRTRQGKTKNTTNNVQPGKGSAPTTRRSTRTSHRAATSLRASRHGAPIASASTSGVAKTPASKVTKPQAGESGNRRSVRPRQLSKTWTEDEGKNAKLLADIVNGVLESDVPTTWGDIKTRLTDQGGPQVVSSTAAKDENAVVREPSKLLTQEEYGAVIKQEAIDLIGEATRNSAFSRRHSSGQTDLMFTTKQNKSLSRIVEDMWRDGITGSWKELVRLFRLEHPEASDELIHGPAGPNHPKPYKKIRMVTWRLMKSGHIPKPAYEFVRNDTVLGLVAKAVEWTPDQLGHLVAAMKRKTPGGWREIITRLREHNIPVDFYGPIDEKIDDRCLKLRWTAFPLIEGDIITKEEYDFVNQYNDNDGRAHAPSGMIEAEDDDEVPVPRKVLGLDEWNDEQKNLFVRVMNEMAEGKSSGGFKSIVWQLNLKHRKVPIRYLEAHCTDIVLPARQAAYELVELGDITHETYMKVATSVRRILEVWSPQQEEAFAQAMIHVDASGIDAWPQIWRRTQRNLPVEQQLPEELISNKHRQWDLLWKKAQELVKSATSSLTQETLDKVMELSKRRMPGQMQRRTDAEEPEQLRPASVSGSSQRSSEMDSSQDQGSRQLDFRPLRWRPLDSDVHMSDGDGRNSSQHRHPSPAQGAGGGAGPPRRNSGEPIHHPGLTATNASAADAQMQDRGRPQRRAATFHKRHSALSKGSRLMKPGNPALVSNSSMSGPASRPSSLSSSRSASASPARRENATAHPALHASGALPTRRRPAK